MSNKNTDMPVLNKSILDVRKVLQDQLERLNAPNCEIEKEFQRSQAINMVATPLIASAKIEADLMARNPKFMGTGYFGNNETKQLTDKK